MAMSQDKSVSGNKEMDRHQEVCDSGGSQRQTTSAMDFNQLRDDLEKEQRLRYRRRQSENEQMLQQFEEDKDYIQRRKESIQKQMGMQGRVPISEYDMKVMRHELMNLEKDLGLLMKRRQKEEDYLKACIEEDGKYLQRRADAIDREERNFLRQQRQEEEEFLEQVKRKEQQAQQSQAESKQKTTVESTDKGQNELAREGDGQTMQEGDGQTMQDTSLDSVNMEQRSSRSVMSDMTDSELQAQLQSLKEEMSKRNIQNMQNANVKSEKESCSNGDGTKGATGGIDNVDRKDEGKDKTPSSEFQKDYYGDTDTTKRKTEYQTIDRIDATRYLDMKSCVIQKYLGISVS